MPLSPVCRPNPPPASELDEQLHPERCPGFPDELVTEKFLGSPKQHFVSRSRTVLPVCRPPADDCVRERRESHALKRIPQANALNNGLNGQAASDVPHPAPAEKTIRHHPRTQSSPRNQADEAGAKAATARPPIHLSSQNRVEVPSPTSTYVEAAKKA